MHQIVGNIFQAVTSIFLADGIFVGIIKDGTWSGCWEKSLDSLMWLFFISLLFILVKYHLIITSLNIT